MGNDRGSLEDKDHRGRLLKPLTLEEHRRIAARLTAMQAEIRALAEEVGDREGVAYFDRIYKLWYRINSIKYRLEGEMLKSCRYELAEARGRGENAAAVYNAPQKEGREC